MSEIAIEQSAAHLGEHEAGVDIPLRREPPVDDGGIGIESPGALGLCGAVAVLSTPRDGAEEAALNVMIITAHQVQVVGDGISGAGPRDLQNLVAKAIQTIGSIVDVCAVDGGTAGTN